MPLHCCVFMQNQVGLDSQQNCEYPPWATQPRRDNIKSYRYLGTTQHNPMLSFHPSRLCLLNRRLLVLDKKRNCNYAVRVDSHEIQYFIVLPRIASLRSNAHRLELLIKQLHSRFDQHAIASLLSVWLCFVDIFHKIFIFAIDIV